jgi:hypothetical protein
MQKEEDYGENEEDDFMGQENIIGGARSDLEDYDPVQMETIELQ